MINMRKMLNIEPRTTPEDDTDNRPNASDTGGNPTRRDTIDLRPPLKNKNNSKWMDNPDIKADTAAERDAKKTRNLKRHTN